MSLFLQNSRRSHEHLSAKTLSTESAAHVSARGMRDADTVCHHLKKKTSVDPHTRCLTGGIQQAQPRTPRGHRRTAVISKGHGYTQARVLAKMQFLDARKAGRLASMSCLPPTDYVPQRRLEPRLAAIARCCWRSVLGACGCGCGSCCCCCYCCRCCLCCCCCG